MLNNTQVKFPDLLPTHQNYAWHYNLQWDIPPLKKKKKKVKGYKIQKAFEPEFFPVYTTDSFDFTVLFFNQEGNGRFYEN